MMIWWEMQQHHIGLTVMFAAWIHCSKAQSTTVTDSFAGAIYGSLTQLDLRGPPCPISFFSPHQTIIRPCKKNTTRCTPGDLHAKQQEILEYPCNVPILSYDIPLNFKHFREMTTHFSGWRTWISMLQRKRSSCRRWQGSEAQDP